MLMLRQNNKSCCTESQFINRLTHKQQKLGKKDGLQQRTVDHYASPERWDFHHFEQVIFDHMWSRHDLDL